MNMENKTIIYRLMISQLRYDGYNDFANQLEFCTGIQARAKNHLCDLVVSIEYQWKITSYFDEKVVMPSIISKNVPSENTELISNNGDSSCGNIGNHSRLFSAHRRTLRRALVETDSPSSNSCIPESMVAEPLHYSPTQNNDAIEQESGHLNQTVSEDRISSIGLTSIRTNESHHDDHIYDNLPSSDPCLSDPSDSIGSEFNSSSTENNRTNSFVKISTDCSNENILVDDDLSSTTSISEKPVFTQDEKVTIFNILHRVDSKKDFKSETDELIPRTLFNTIEQILSATFSDLADKYIVISEDSIRLKSKYGKMTSQGLLTSICAVNKKDGHGKGISDKDNSSSFTEFKKSETKPITVKDSCVKVQADSAGGCASSGKSDSIDSVSVVGEDSILSLKLFQSSLNFNQNDKKLLFKLLKGGTISKTDFKLKAYALIPRTLFNTTEQILFAIFGKNLFKCIIIVDNSVRMREIYCKMSIKELILRICPEYNLTTSEIQGMRAKNMISDNKPAKTQTNDDKEVVKQPLSLTAKKKKALIKLLTDKDMYEFAEFWSKAKTIVTQDYNIKEILIAIFSTEFSTFIQFRYETNFSYLSLKPPWKSQSAGEIFKSINVLLGKKNTFPDISKKDKILLINLMKNIRSCEAFKAKVDFLVPSLKQFSFDDIMNLLFDQYVSKYVFFQNDNICWVQRFRETPSEGIYDSIKQTIKNSSKKSSK